MIFNHLHIPQMRRVSAQGHSVVEAGARSPPPPSPCRYLQERGPRRAPRAQSGAFWTRHPAGESDETSYAAPLSPCKDLEQPRMAPCWTLALPSAQRADSRGGGHEEQPICLSNRLVFFSITGSGAAAGSRSGPFVAIGIPRPRIMMTNSHRFRQLQGPLWQCAPRGAGVEIPQAAP